MIIPRIPPTLSSSVMVNGKPFLISKPVLGSQSLQTPFEYSILMPGFEYVVIVEDKNNKIAENIIETIKTIKYFLKLFTSRL